jgi:hypothetical protein
LNGDGPFSTGKEKAMPSRRKKKEEPAAPASGLRLPSMSAQLALAPATRSYRSPMGASLSGGSMILPSQWEDESESEEFSDDPMEVTTNETDEVVGDVAENDEPDGSDEDQGFDQEAEATV